MSFVQTDPAARGAELIAVQIGEQRFAVDVMAVREIRGWAPSTYLPQAPAYVLGLINLRGAVLPVIDLGARLGLGPVAQQASAVVVVVEFGTSQFGLLVDAVCDILAVGHGQVCDPPLLGAVVGPAFVRGLINSEDGIITVLDLAPIVGELDLDEAA